MTGLGNVAFPKYATSGLLKLFSEAIVKQPQPDRLLAHVTFGPMWYSSSFILPYKWLWLLGFAGFFVAAATRLASLGFTSNKSSFSYEDETPL